MIMDEDKGEEKAQGKVELIHLTVSNTSMAILNGGLRMRPLRRQGAVPRQTSVCR